MSMMLARLANATRDLRFEVDRVWTSPIESPTRASYRTYLASLYAFRVPFEAALVARSSLEFQFLKPRLHAGKLAADLIALRVGPAEYRILARTFPIPAFDPIEALGWLYVA